MANLRFRIDQIVHERGLADSRQKARALVMAGRVCVDGHRIDKPGAMVANHALVEVKEGPRFVSRGGVKLAHALDRFELDVHGAIGLDVGASTGGFTDCMLQRGAATVYAIDVGYGQLDYRLRIDPRVIVEERVNARHRFELPSRVTVATIDVSFISLTLVLPNVLRHMAPGGAVICLVKPQFEAGRNDVGRGGVVKDPVVHGNVLGKIGLWAINQQLRISGITPSPIVGDKGNREFFVLLRPAA